MKFIHNKRTGACLLAFVLMRTAAGAVFAEGVMEQAKSPGPAAGAKETVTLGGGCFWCLEPVFQELKGVEDVVVGYAGGHTENPAYREVTTGETGHAEVVQIRFNPDTVSFKDLLEVFFSIHDPTTRNRQGADVGTQYRSIILFHNEDQKKTAEAVIRELNARDIWPNPIVTEVVPIDVFYRAEDYHQEYYANQPDAPYCRLVITPKMEKFRKVFEARLKAE